MNPLYYTLSESAQLPAGVDWLTVAEKERYDRFRFDKRRSDWLLGRWAAKSALACVAGLSGSELERLEIGSDPDGAPSALLDGRPCPGQLSLSHSHGRAFCVVTCDDTEVGCDIELVEPRDPEFVETFFTDAERTAIVAAESETRDALVTLAWSAKESALKALRTGLTTDTRSVEVDLGVELRQAGWQLTHVATRSAGNLVCFWRTDGRYVLTVVTRGPVDTPLRATEANRTTTVSTCGVSGLS